MSDQVLKHIISLIYRNIDESVEASTSLFNHPRFMELVFGHPIKRSPNIIDKYNYSILSSTDANNISVLILGMMSFNEYYADMYKKYSAMFTDLKSLPYIIKYPFNITKISDYLDEIGVDHCINFNFCYVEPHTKAHIVKPYSFNLDLKVDILGMLAHSTNDPLTKKVCLFAIIINPSDPNIYYYLETMNINVLRIRNMENYIKQIRNFFKLIEKGNYVKINPKPHPYDLLELEPFFNNYDTNHNTYLKYHRQSKIIDETYEPEKNITCDASESYPVDNNVYETIMARYQ